MEDGCRDYIRDGVLALLNEYGMGHHVTEEVIRQIVAMLENGTLPTHDQMVTLLGLHPESARTDIKSSSVSLNDHENGANLDVDESVANDEKESNVGESMYCGEIKPDLKVEETSRDLDNYAGYNGITIKAQPVMMKESLGMDTYHTDTFQEHSRPALNFLSHVITQSDDPTKSVCLEDNKASIVLSKNNDGCDRDTIGHSIDEKCFLPVVNGMKSERESIISSESISNLPFADDSNVISHNLLPVSHQFRNDNERSALSHQVSGSEMDSIKGTGVNESCIAEAADPIDNAEMPKPFTSTNNYTQYSKTTTHQLDTFGYSLSPTIHKPIDMEDEFPTSRSNREQTAVQHFLMESSTRSDRKYFKEKETIVDPTDELKCKTEMFVERNKMDITETQSTSIGKDVSDFSEEVVMYNGPNSSQELISGCNSSLSKEGGDTNYGRKTISGTFCLRPRRQVLNYRENDSGSDGEDVEPQKLNTTRNKACLATSSLKQDAKKHDSDEDYVIDNEDMTEPVDTYIYDKPDKSDQEQEEQKSSDGEACKDSIKSTNGVIESSIKETNVPPDKENTPKSSASCNNNEIDRESKEREVFTCTLCYSFYKSKKRLKNHMQCKHDALTKPPGEKGEQRGGNLKVFTCPYCKEVYGLRDSLSRHMKSKHESPTKSQGEKVKKRRGNPKALKCPYCEAVYANKYNLKRHMQCKHDVTTKPQGVEVKAFDCLYCKAVYENKYSLKRHMERKHDLPTKPQEAEINQHENPKAFKCPHCTAVYGLKGSLHRHMKWKHDDPKMRCGRIVRQCPICNEMCDNVDVLFVHIKEKHSETKTGDNDTESRTGQAETLTSIIKDELGKRRVKCELCQTVCRSFDHAYKHMVLEHSIVMPRYKCHLCTSEFFWKYKLTQHLKFHNNNTNWQDAMVACNVCRQKFRTSTELVTHCTDVHMDLMKYACELCDMSSSSLEEIKSHIRGHVIETNRVKSDRILASIANRPESGKGAKCHIESPSKGTDETHEQSSIGMSHPQVQTPTGDLSADVHNNHQARATLAVATSTTRNEDDGDQQQQELHASILSKHRATCCDECGTVCYSMQALNAHVLTDHMHSKISLELAGHVFHFPRYYCFYCCEPLCSKSSKSLHEKSHFDEPFPYKCAVCGERFTNRSSCRAHMNNHRKSKLIGCGQCNVVFKDSQGFKLHQSDSHGVVKSENNCRFCRSKFSTQYHLEKHIAMHHFDINKGINMCLVCNKRFCGRSALERHNSTVHKQGEKHLCAFCGQEFYNLCNYKRHLITHTGEKPFKCDFCGKCYSSKTVLNAHSCRGQKIKQEYICPTCGKSFRSSMVFLRHKRIHTGEKPYECKVCGFRFNQGCSLKRHIKTQHPELH